MSSTRTDFYYLFHLNVKQWREMQLYAYFSWNKFSTNINKKNQHIKVDFFFSAALLPTEESEEMEEEEDGLGPIAEIEESGTVKPLI